jgi:hypothetical protein
MCLQRCHQRPTSRHSNRHTHQHTRRLGRQRAHLPFIQPMRPRMLQRTTRHSSRRAGHRLLRRHQSQQPLYRAMCPPRPHHTRPLTTQQLCPPEHPRMCPHHCRRLNFPRTYPRASRHSHRQLNRLTHQHTSRLLCPRGIQHHCRRCHPLLYRHQYRQVIRVLPQLPTPPYTQPHTPLSLRHKCQPTQSPIDRRDLPRRFLHINRQICQHEGQPACQRLCQRRCQPKSQLGR